MPWAPGQSGNPKGYDGPRRRRNQEVYDEIKSRGHQSPLITLSEIHTDPNREPAVRVAAAGMLAPFLHAKLQSITVPRFIENPIDIPAEFTTVQEAESFLARIASLVAKGELDFQSGLELSTLAKNWIEAKTASEFETRLTIIEQTIELTPTTTTAVIGGLPRLAVGPGEPDIIMPGSNGHQLPAPDDKPPINGNEPEPSP